VLIAEVALVRASLLGLLHSAPQLRQLVLVQHRHCRSLRKTRQSSNAHAHAHVSVEQQAGCCWCVVAHLQRTPPRLLQKHGVRRRHHVTGC
jgi:hypothetical protein